MPNPPTLGIQAVHHTTDELQLILEAKVDEVGINKNSVGWNKGRVVSEEKRRSNWCSEQILG
jgi:hypothetical protein